MQQPIPSHWVPLIERYLPYWQVLAEGDRLTLLQRMQVLIADKQFEASKGFELRDEMRVVVAANACVLLLRRHAEYFPHLGSVVLYPKTFRARVRRPLDGGAELVEEEERSGESWEYGTVVLAWNEVVESCTNGDDYNVVWHEFAHQLDVDWVPIYQTEFDRLVRESDAGRQTFLDPYGAESREEFFAVITETFFGASQEMRRSHPELYEALTHFYKQDPAALYDRAHSNR